MNNAVKHFSFEHEPIKNKHVWNIPGIAYEHRGVFAQYGITTASQLLGQFMMFDLDIQRFISWLTLIAPMININDINHCANSLKAWCDNNL